MTERREESVAWTPRLEIPRGLSLAPRSNWMWIISAASARSLEILFRLDPLKPPLFIVEKSTGKKGIVPILFTGNHGDALKLLRTEGKENFKRWKSSAAACSSCNHPICNRAWMDWNSALEYAWMTCYVCNRMCHKRHRKNVLGTNSRDWKSRKVWDTQFLCSRVQTWKIRLSQQ